MYSSLFLLEDGLLLGEGLLLGDDGWPSGGAKPRGTGMSVVSSVPLPLFKSSESLFIGFLLRASLMESNASCWLSLLFSRYIFFGLPGTLSDIFPPLQLGMRERAKHGRYC